MLVAWGFSDEGERVLLAVTLGMRESCEDWQALGRDLIARGLGAPMLIVADGAPGLIKAIEQCWPASDRQRCCVHRARNLYAKLPESERERVKQAYWQALDDAIHENDAKQRLQALVARSGDQPRGSRQTEISEQEIGGVRRGAAEALKPGGGLDHGRRQGHRTVCVRPIGGVGVTHAGLPHVLKVGQLHDPVVENLGLAGHDGLPSGSISVAASWRNADRALRQDSSSRVTT